jgi:ankyrin repeat protein
MVSGFYRRLSGRYSVVRTQRKRFVIMKRPIERIRLSGLHDAIRSGSMDEVKRLLANDPELAHAKFQGSFALNVACDAGHLSIVELLIVDSKVDPNQASDHDTTPLWTAIFRARIELIRLLHKLGADLNRDSSSGTPLESAIFGGGSREIVELLLDLGARANLPLHTAALGGSPAVVRLFLELGYDANEQDREQQTPLSIARKRPHKKIESLLLEAGALMPRQVAANRRQQK